jgi:DNA-binding NarL/FixJ family response regulator
LLDKWTQQKIGVFLVAESPIARLAAHSVVSQQEDIEIVGQAGSTNEAFSVASELPPKAVAVHAIPPKGSFELVYRLREISPEISVIALAEYEDDEGLFQAIRAGAAAFLTKESTNEELLDTIRRVSHGELPVGQSLLNRPGVALRILERFQEPSFMTTGLEPLVAPLSPSENEVLNLIASGNSVEAIASALNISKPMVGNYVTSILHKLDVNERTHQAVLALRVGKTR